MKKTIGNDRYMAFLWSVFSSIDSQTLIHHHSPLGKIILCDVEATKIDLMNTAVTNNRVLEPWKQFS